MASKASKRKAAEEEQAELLREMSLNVKRHAFNMKRAVDGDDLKDALKHASLMLNELRTGALTPSNYYQLYMAVFDELQFLEIFFIDVHRKGHTDVIKLYETVQHAGNVLTRLYLLITVGSVYIWSKAAPARDILRDMVEMVKGVQQPTRGLFLRYYLSQKTKDKLPDLNSEYEGHGGNVQDAIDFVLQNFSEMLRLWVRMQHQGAVRQRKRRERERRELKILVGSSLVRLSSLDGVDLNVYKNVVLPRILEQVTNCKDKIAQQYLMDCVVHVFPAEYHLQTLDAFLTTCRDLMADVNVKKIMIACMDRIAGYTQTEGDAIPADINAFEIFNKHTGLLIEDRQATMGIGDVLELESALLRFSVTAYKSRLDYVDHVLKFCADILEAAGDERLDSDNMQWVVHLLTLPQDTFALNVLQLNNYPTLMKFLVFSSRRSVAVKLLQSVLSSNARLDSVSDASRLLTFLAPLVKDEDDTPTDETDNNDEFLEEQTSMAKLVHLMHHDDTDIRFRIFGTARKFFGHGGTRRIPHTLVPLVFRSLALARDVRQRELAGDAPAFASRKVFQFIHEICTALASSHPELALRLFLQSALGADAAGFDPIAYEFMSQAFILYEDLVGTKVQVQAINLIISTLRNCGNFTPENYEVLVTRATQFSAKLLQKADQCRMVSLCAQLFWRDALGKKAAAAAAKAEATQFHKAKEVLECLQRSLKIADVCMPVSCQLFVQILNQYMYFFEKRCPTIVVMFITGLIALINEHIDTMEAGAARSEVEAHFKNTLLHIELMQQKGDSDLYQGVEIA